MTDKHPSTPLQVGDYVYDHRARRQVEVVGFRQDLHIRWPLTSDRSGFRRIITPTIARMLEQTPSKIRAMTGLSWSTIHEMRLLLGHCPPMRPRRRWTPEQLAAIHSDRSATEVARELGVPRQTVVTLRSRRKRHEKS